MEGPLCIPCLEIQILSLSLYTYTIPCLVDNSSMLYHYIAMSLLTIAIKRGDSPSYSWWGNAYIVTYYDCICSICSYTAEHTQLYNNMMQETTSSKGKTEENTPKVKPAHVHAQQKVQNARWLVRLGVLASARPIGTFQKPASMKFTHYSESHSDVSQLAINLLLIHMSSHGNFA